MNIYQKLVEVRKSVPYLQKEAQGAQYQYVGSSQVLAAVRAKMDELGLLLTVKVIGHNVQSETVENRDKYDKLKKTTTYFTELDLEFTWINADNPEETLTLPFYGQGVDIAGEKGVGKALTYAEKYFLLKQFNIATDKDDPDSFQEKSESYRKPDPISAHDLGTLKARVLEFAQLRNKTDAEVYAVLNISDLESLNEREAKLSITKLNGWIASAKKELSKKGA
ncbi:ERF family protein [Heyndrickxia camelliae]|uniref:Single-stranded DNA-binding protein n=1 Tax=Heyndrickxia camelliae TaxID=1707093 RepID=A0A2N3LK93_9BACI|nr:ERF family protein [Heyndrickxia camelliae]PKR85050.1 single-stranded DNA-binding protein [Heyndrickxia camelliae]